MSKSEYSEAPAVGAGIDVGTKSYDRIFGMLLGIRVHVSRISNQDPSKIQIRSKHFNEYEKIDIPREGNRIAPAHKGNYDYKFKTYAPHVFRKLRLGFNVSDDEYLMSLTADYMMSELKTIGRSSAMFYYTWDGRYVLKTQTKEEMKVLQKILPAYYEHVTNHPDTLVNQFYGAYRSQTSIGRKIHFVVMNNIFPIGYQIHYKFDLKGSVINRSVDEAKRNHPGSTWKEAEFSEKRYLKVGPRDWALLKSQLLDDTHFLAFAGVMDYSLLVGIHFLDQDSHVLHPAPGERIELWTIFIPDRSAFFQYDGNSVIVRRREEAGGKRSKRKDVEPKKTDMLSRDGHHSITPQAATLPYQVNDQCKLLNFCGGLRASNENDEPLNEIYFLGFIDFLQDYGARKGLEHLMKSVIYKHDEMSCIPPERYATRMFDYLTRTIGPSEELLPGQESAMLRRRRILQAMATPTTQTLRPGSRMLELPLEEIPKEHHGKHHKVKKTRPVGETPQERALRKAAEREERHLRKKEERKKKERPWGGIPPPVEPGESNSESSSSTTTTVKEGDKTKADEVPPKAESPEEKEKQKEEESEKSASEKKEEEKPKEEPKEESSESSSPEKKEEPKTEEVPQNVEEENPVPVEQAKEEEPKEESSSSSSSDKKEEEKKEEEKKEEEKKEEEKNEEEKKEESSETSSSEKEPKVEEVSPKAEEAKEQKKEAEKPKKESKKSSDDSDSLSGSSLSDSSDISFSSSDESTDSSLSLS